MADIKLAEKLIPEGFKNAKVTVLGYSYSDGLYVKLTSGEEKSAVTVNQAEKWFGIPILETLLEKMQEKSMGTLKLVRVAVL